MNAAGTWKVLKNTTLPFKRTYCHLDGFWPLFDLVSSGPVENTATHCALLKVHLHRAQGREDNQTGLLTQSRWSRAYSLLALLCLETVSCDFSAAKLFLEQSFNPSAALQLQVSAVSASNNYPLCLAAGSLARPFALFPSFSHNELTGPQNPRTDTRFFCFFKPISHSSGTSHSRQPKHNDAYHLYPVAPDPSKIAGTL